MVLSLVTNSLVLPPTGLYMGMWGRFWTNTSYSNPGGNQGTTPRDPLGVGTSYTADTNLTALKQYEADAGHHCAIAAAWLNFGTAGGSDYGTWGTATGNQAFAWMKAVVAHGSIPFITWSPTGSTIAAPNLSSILNGSQDSYLQSVGTQIAAYGGPLMIRMMHEMNGTWYTHWSPGQTDSGLFITPELYRQAWRYIVDKIRAQGAANVQWVYCPNKWSATSEANAMDQFPGHGYVNWIGIDGYNNQNSTGWSLFNALFAYSYNAIVGNSAYNGIPIMIPETGCSPSGSTSHTKASWYADVFNPASATGIFNYPRIRAWIHFNEDKRVQEQAAGMTNLLEQAYPVEADESTTLTSGDIVTGAGSPGAAIANAVSANPSLFRQSWP